MANGLQVFNENGRITLDLTSRTTRYLGKGNTGATNGQLTDNNIGDNDEVWVSVIAPSEKTNYSKGFATPKFTIKNKTISWQVNAYVMGGTLGQFSGNVVPLDFIYGVY